MGSASFIVEPPRRSAEQLLQQFVAGHMVGIGYRSQNTGQGAYSQWIMIRHGHMVLGWNVASQANMAT